VPIALPAVPPSPPGGVGIPTIVTLTVTPPTLGSDYLLGGTVRVRATFRNQLTNALITPDTLAFHVRQGYGAIVYTYNVNPLLNDPAIALISLGVYDLTLTLTASGKGAVRAISTGTYPGSAVSQWNCFDPNF
jgi:hypothetical protein